MELLHNTPGQGALSKRKSNLSDICTDLEHSIDQPSASECNNAAAVADERCPDGGNASELEIDKARPSEQRLPHSSLAIELASRPAPDKFAKLDSGEPSAAVQTLAPESSAGAPSAPGPSSGTTPETPLKHFFNIDNPGGRLAPGTQGVGVDRRSAPHRATTPRFAAPPGPPWQWFSPQGIRKPPEDGPVTVDHPMLQEAMGLADERAFTTTVSGANTAPTAEQSESSFQSALVDAPVGERGVPVEGAGRSLDDLPRVLLLAVLGRLSQPKDVLAFAASCRAGREAAGDVGLWKALFTSKWGVPATLAAKENLDVSLQHEYAARECLLQELRSSPFLAGEAAEPDGPLLCRQLSRVLDLLLVESLLVCQGHATTLLKETDLFLGLLRIFRRPPTAMDDPAYFEAYSIACVIYGTLVRRCQKLAGARLLRREDGRPPGLHDSSAPQCRFSHESIFARFVQQLKLRTMYQGALALPDPHARPRELRLEVCEALLPHMYLLPVQIWELATPIADWNGVEWPRFSEEPFRRWLLPDWRGALPGLWHGYYMFRNQGQLGAPDPAMHITLTRLQETAPRAGGDSWAYAFSGMGDDGMGSFSIEGTIRPVPPPDVPTSRRVLGGVEFSKVYAEPLEEDGLLMFVGQLTALGMVGVWGNKLTEHVKGTWALTPVSAFPNNARMSLC